MPTTFDQADASSLYEQMRPDQRTAIALEFVRCLRLAGDSQAEQFMAEAEKVERAEPLQQGSAADEPVVVTGGALETPRLLSAQQAAAIHRYTFERHPDCFTEILHHPLTQAVLAAPGESPADESPAEEAPAQG